MTDDTLSRRDATWIRRFENAESKFRLMLTLTFLMTAGVAFLTALKFNDWMETDREDLMDVGLYVGLLALTWANLAIMDSQRQAARVIRNLRTGPAAPPT